MVSNTHIDALLTAALHGRHGGGRWSYYHDGARIAVDYSDADQLGAMLLAENRASVNHRYREDDLEPIYTFRPLPGVADPVVVLKALACYEYQSCEHDGWESSEAKSLCDELRHEMIAALPGYNDAAGWSIAEGHRDVFGASRGVRP